jgi:hypothetical protein
MGAVKGLTEDGLFGGQTPEFLHVLKEVASAADAATPKRLTKPNECALEPTGVSSLTPVPRLVTPRSARARGFSARPFRGRHSRTENLD